MKKAVFATSAALVAFSVLVWAKQSNPHPLVPMQEESGPEEQGREMLRAAANANLPKQVLVQVEFIELPHETLTELLYMKRPGVADSGMLRDTVQSLVKEEEAAVLETMVCIARSGEKSLVESIAETIYPTEYEPPALPESVTVSGDGKEVSPDLPALERLVSPPTPTSFETRNVGSTLEFEPTIGANDKIVDLRIAPNLVWYTGRSEWLRRKDSLGNEISFEMPQIYNIRLTTALTCLDGQYNMVAVASPKDARGITDPSRKVMIFVKCDIVVVK